jgi:hypothetical protein
MRSFPFITIPLGFLAAGFLAAPAPDVAAADLKPETLEAFSRYVSLTEARIQNQVADPKRFLYVEQLPAPRRFQVFAELKQGRIFMDHIETRDASGGEIDAPGALIHHWVGDVFIPGASLGQVLDLVEDYNHHQEVYKPEVVRSRLISRDGNDFKIFYRLVKHKVITVTLDTEHDVRYTRVDDAHRYSRSVSTRIAEVADAGKPDEHEKPPGQDGGFLWALNSYWRFVERDGGVYVECESISLTRDIPTGLGWLIGPFVTSIPKESLEHTLGSTRSAVLAKMAGAPTE